MRNLLVEMVQRICWLPGRALFRFFFHFEVQGDLKQLEELPDSFLIVANHGSWLDPFFVGGAFPPRSRFFPLYFATWHTYYKNPFLFPFVWLLGAFPVKKGEGLENTLSYPLRILQNGGRVVIFPEGKRRYRGRPRKGRRGAAWLALRARVPILPVYIKGNIGVTIKGFLSRSEKVSIYIGRPFTLQNDPSHPLDPTTIDRFSAVIVSKIQ